jgi:hypothetical protein
MSDCLQAATAFKECIAWAEPLSWLAGIGALLVAGGGLGIAFYQLADIRRDQKRVAEDLARRPVLVIGFDERYAPPGGGGIRPEALLPKGVKEPEIGFTVLNNGDRTARDLDLNFHLPCEIFSSNADATKVVVTQERDDDGAFRVKARCQALNPGTHILVKTWLRPSSTTPSPFPVTVSYGMADAPAGELSLIVRSV